MRRAAGNQAPLRPFAASSVLFLALALAGTSGGVGHALATRALQGQQRQGPPPNQNCTANATAGGYDCVVDGQFVHVNTTANVTQVQAPGTVVWNDASTGDVTVTAPGVRVVCKTDPTTQEQHCSVQTAWWSSSTTTTNANATRAGNNGPAAASPRRPSSGSRLLLRRGRGLARTRVEESEDGGGGVRVAAGGPATDITTDCRPSPGTTGGYNCSHAGQWAHVATDPATNATQVTAPGVSVQTNGSTGDLEVDAWGVHVVCRRDPRTGRTACTTHNAWWPPASGWATDEEAAPTVVPIAEEEPATPYTTTVTTARPVPAQPVMHLPPTQQQQQQQQASKQAAEVAAADKAPILPYAPTGAAAAHPPSPGYFPTEPAPTLPPAVQQAAQGQQAAAVLVKPTPAVAAVPAQAPAQQQQQNAARGSQARARPFVAIDPMPAVAMDPPTYSESAAELTPIVPFSVVAAGNDKAAAATEQGVGGERPPKFPRPVVVTPGKPTPPTAPTPSPQGPSSPPPNGDPLWTTNPKNCTRASKGEGKGCWEEEHWLPKPKTPLPVATKPSSNGTHPAVSAAARATVPAATGEAVVVVAVSADGKQQRWGEERDPDEGKEYGPEGRRRVLQEGDGDSGDDDEGDEENARNTPVGEDGNGED